MTHHHEFDDPELEPVAARLREARPQLSALELDEAKRRVMARANNPARTRTTNGGFMKSRLTILAMLVLGMLLSTTGAGLALQGSTDSAAVSQYGREEPDDDGGVLPEQEAGGDEDGGQGGVGGEQDGAPGPEDGGGLQPTRQIEAGADGAELPFTGLAAIPLLLGGIALLTTGLVLRRNSKG